MRAASIKKPAEAGFSQHFKSVVAAHDAENLQQADEQVVDRYIQADGRHDVVALAAMDDRTGLEQDAGRGEQHETCADCQLQTADLEEEASNHCAQQDKETSSDKATEEAHVLAGGQHVSRQAAEHKGCHGKSRADNFSTVGHAHVAIEDWAEGVAHKTG